MPVAALDELNFIIGNGRRLLCRFINGSVHDHESWNGRVCGNCSVAGCADPDCEMGQWTGPTWPVSTMRLEIFDPRCLDLGDILANVSWRAVAVPAR